MQRPRSAKAAHHRIDHGGDPHAEHASYHDLDSRISLFGHPIHAMLVAFPIAGCFADDALIGGMLAFERALARAEGACGAIPAAVASEQPVTTYPCGRMIPGS